MTSNEIVTSRPDGFALTVPDHWARFDLSEAPFASARRAALKSAQSQVERSAVDDLFRQARAINKAARRRGALWGAGTATRYDDVMFLGHVMVFGIQAGQDIDLSPMNLARQLGREGAPSGDGGEPVWPRTVAPVHLAGAGDAVRIVGTERVNVAAGTVVDMLTMHTLVNVPGAETERFLVTCCSPNVPLAEQVYELFDAISGTFRFTTNT
jgi:hypothetical protein